MKQGVIKIIALGSFTLTHMRFIGGFGDLQDSFVLMRTDPKSALKQQIILYPPFKAMNYTLKTNLFKLPRYTKKDYEKMLDEGIKTFQKYYG